MKRIINNKRLVGALLRNRNRSEKDIDSVLKNYEATRRPKSIRGVRNGQFYRINLPPRQTVLELPKIPSPIGSTPKPLQSLPPVEPAAAAVAAEAPKTERIKDSFDRLWEFLQLNGAVLIMNAGSFCTLLAFTRTDVLELRALSVTGSLCFIVYNLAQAPIKWLTIGWTTLFASVNTWKIVEIVYERHSHVEMTPEQEECYTKYFMPHGITPKQFEVIEGFAQRIAVPNNEPLIKQGQRLENVYLVVEGSTRASILGRYLTAASTADTPMTEAERGGGNAGAWVGEMAFLESYWETEQGKVDGSSRSTTAMYTVVAKQDCVVWQWSHADMGKLMKKSSDMRSALTRAMTSAIVGKVINFTVSRTSARPSWQTWLDDWKLARAAREVAQATPTPTNTASFVADAGEEESKPIASAADVGKESPA